MKPTIKTLLATLLLFFITTGIMAQEKYEYAVAQYLFGAKYFVTVSINGEKYEETPVEPSSVKGKNFGWDLTPLLKKISELQDQGWEVYSTDRAEAVFIYHLRKKKN